MAKRKPFLHRGPRIPALHEHGATAEEVATAFGDNPSTIRNTGKEVRDWLGITPCGL